MLKKVQNLISGRVVLVLFLVTNAVYIFMLTYSIPRVLHYSDGLALFDISPFGYSYQDAMALLNQLGEEGRHIYLSLQLVADAFYPLLFGASYFVLLLWIIKVGKFVHRAWYVLSLIPLLVCMLDYGENFAVWLMLTNYPQVSESVVGISSFLTVSKSGLTTVYFIGLIISLGIFGFRALNEKFGAKQVR